MNKILPLALLLILFCGISYAEEIFVKTGDKPGNSFSFNVNSSNSLRTSITAELSGFYHRKFSQSGTEYSNVYIKDQVSLGNPGEASLPVVTKFVQIPNNRNVRVLIRNSAYEVFSNFRVAPYSAPPLRDTRGNEQAAAVNSSYYSTNEFLPNEIVSVREIAVFRDVRIAVVSISPVQYNPLTGELKAYSLIDFELVYEGSSKENNVSSLSQGVARSFENLYKELIVNYEAPSHFTSAPKLLVLVADELYQGVLPLTDWKVRKGIKTTIVKKSDIAGVPSPTSEQVKTYLTQIYNSSDRPEFVLLVGDASGTNTFPWFTATGGKSDHPYQCLEGTDILPDIVVGRISVQTLPELDSAVSKLLQYEKQPNMLQTDWYKRAMVLHSNDGIDPINGQVARSVFLNEGGFTNVDMVNNSFSQSQITGMINQGVSWIWFIGHGSSTSWADPVWNMSNMPNLTFGLKQPSIVSIACSNADLDYSTTNDCFGEAWIERGRGNSASNIAASTELCAFYTTDTIGREMLYAYFRHGIYDFGSMLNYGKVKAYQYFNGNGTVVETINQFMTLGDPTQEAFSDVPKNVSVTSTVNGNDYIVNIKSSGVNMRGALVAIHQTDTLKTSGYTDSLGNYIFSKNIVTENLPITAVVTGKNLHPFEGNLILTSISNLSNLADGFALMQNYPNPFNPSTVIRFNIPDNTYATLRVYDILGKQVAELVDGNLSAGEYKVDFNASDLAAGVYLYKLDAGDYSKTMKMTIVK
ncbi:MAG: T9SS type A sorting domain-containing protein [Ignavibacteria bacterium]|nr:T9SS type A sorting domain-containing protein [Ignavibacteria bacterium]